jgi:hypothetical protein
VAIPEADLILAALRAEGIDANEKAVRAAIQHAKGLARWPIDEPAAIFFAFACRPRAVPGVTRFAVFLARERLDELKLTLSATDAELFELMTKVRLRSIDENDVLSWFAERLPSD